MSWVPILIDKIPFGIESRQRKSPEYRGRPVRGTDRPKLTRLFPSPGRSYTPDTSTRRRSGTLVLPLRSEFSTGGTEGPLRPHLHLSSQPWPSITGRGLLPDPLWESWDGSFLSKDVYLPLPIGDWRRTVSDRDLSNPNHDPFDTRGALGFLSLFTPSMEWLEISRRVRNPHPRRSFPQDLDHETEVTNETS